MSLIFQRLCTKKFYTQLKSLSSFFTQVFDTKSSSYVSSSGGVCMAASKGNGLRRYNREQRKGLPLRKALKSSVLGCVCASGRWRMLGWVCTCVCLRLESIHYSESTNTTCPVSLLIFSLAARLSRFGSCRSLSDPERHMKSRESREMYEY